MADSTTEMVSSGKTALNVFGPAAPTAVDPQPSSTSTAPNETAAASNKECASVAVDASTGAPRSERDAQKMQHSLATAVDPQPSSTSTAPNETAAASKEGCCSYAVDMSTGAPRSEKDAQTMQHRLATAVDPQQSSTSTASNETAAASNERCALAAIDAAAATVYDPDEFYTVGEEVYRNDTTIVKKRLCTAVSFNPTEITTRYLYYSFPIKRSKTNGEE